MKIGKYDFGDWQFDYFAFFHKDHHALVQVKPVVKIATEPGKAPPTPQIDASAPDYFVLMERDFGSKRHPSIYITIGSGVIFYLLCRALHRRDQRLNQNLELEAAGA